MKKIEKRTKRGRFTVMLAGTALLLAGCDTVSSFLNDTFSSAPQAPAPQPATAQAGAPQGGTGKPAQAMLPPAPLPRYVPGDTFVYRVGNATMREQVLTTTPDRVVWTNDQGLIWTTGYDLVSPMLSWSADPELGRGRQDIVDGNPASLFPLTAGEQVAFQVTGSSEKQPGGWKMDQRCEVAGQAQVTVEAGTFNTFQIGCQRGDTLETLFYSPVVQNYVLRTRQFPFRSERKELAGFQHAELREAKDEQLVAMTEGDSRQASLGRSTEMPVDPSAAQTLPPAPPVPPAGAMMPVGAPAGDMAALVQRLEAVLARMEQLMGGQGNAARLPGAAPSAMAPNASSPMTPPAAQPLPRSASSGAPLSLTGQPPAPSQPTQRQPPQQTASAAPARPGEQFGLHLGSYRELPAAERGWDILKERYPSLLGPLKPFNSEFRTGDTRGAFVRLVAGPFPSRDAATKACNDLAARRQFCQVVSLNDS
ncbi:SPOR domain-containing protein [Oceanibaculum sp.]|uniref:SPOR domain-containing protein n=1 Tax=Oceanibaculum sp. TaxID=1903597 RepID=UPI002591144D|nr:SPOR domain-containing protein [Oceanibaculum sp.]MCH2393913.1 SPOR domain-containing protein [Oceanibaculum sp.]